MQSLLEAVEYDERAGHSLGRSGPMCFVRRPSNASACMGLSNASIWSHSNACVPGPSMSFLDQHVVSESLLDPVTLSSIISDAAPSSPMSEVASLRSPAHALIEKMKDEGQSSFSNSMGSGGPATMDRIPRSFRGKLSTTISTARMWILSRRRCILHIKLREHSLGYLASHVADDADLHPSIEPEAAADLRTILLGPNQS